MPETEATKAAVKEYRRQKQRFRELAELDTLATILIALKMEPREPDTMGGTNLTRAMVQRQLVAKTRAMYEDEA